jgi:hypothetical protein
MLPHVMRTVQNNIHGCGVSSPLSLRAALHGTLCFQTQWSSNPLTPLTLSCFVWFVMDLKLGQADTEPNAVCVCASKPLCSVCVSLIECPPNQATTCPMGMETVRKSRVPAALQAGARNLDVTATSTTSLAAIDEATLLNLHRVFLLQPGQMEV